MKKAFLISFLFSLTAIAQDDTTKTTVPYKYNVFKEKVHFWQLEKNWKISPLEIFSAVSTVGVDLETKMTDKLSFQYGAAIVPSFMQVVVGSQEGRFRWMNGYKIRFESRFYLFKKPARYLSSELSFRHLIISENANIAMESNNNGNFAFTIQEKRNYNRFSSQFNLKFGIQKVYKNQFLIDFYTGLSLRRNIVNSKADIVEGGQLLPSRNLLNWTLEDKYSFSYVTPVVGIKIGFHRAAKKNI